MYLLYVALFAILLLVELISYNLVTIWISLAALVTAIFAYFFPNLIVMQIILLLVLSIVFVVLTKSVMTKLKYAKEKTNIDRLIGMEGIVLEQINPMEGIGQVKISGQIWSAKTEDGQGISLGEHIVVRKIEGVKLVVERKESLCRN